MCSSKRSSPFSGSLEMLTSTFIAICSSAPRITPQRRLRWWMKKGNQFSGFFSFRFHHYLVSFRFSATSLFLGRRGGEGKKKKLPLDGMEPRPTCGEGRERERVENAPAVGEWLEFFRQLDKVSERVFGEREFALRLAHLRHPCDNAQKHLEPGLANRLGCLPEVSTPRRVRLGQKIVH
mmetsp:Transcript_6888/g.17819  ORF Transcript_6888/g.17819 Transcript_6888/m.17819 type:complete len:179 (+) Transcript_6888:708-1244(+)